jgi:hypothetical protein
LSSRRSVALALLVFLAGCRIEEVEIPRTKPRVALHAVLSATAPSQVMLLERTRTGSVTIIGEPFELENPFVNDEGIAEPGALATLVAPDGQVYTGREDLTPGGTGAGVYRFPLPGALLDRSGSYRLTVVTTAGETLRSESAVPGGVAAEFAEDTTFDRAADTLLLAWPRSARARSYFVRVETPFGPRAFFTTDTSVRLTGELRNVNLSTLRHVFIPGYPQAVTVSAVDSNFYDWFRSQNGELSGEGLINRVEGGLGVFGSLVRLRFVALTVVAPQPEPIAGTFLFTGTPDEQLSAPYSRLDLYVESQAAHADQDDALSGRYTRQMRLGDTGCAVCGLLGTARGGHIELAFLRDWFASDTAEYMTGELRGDTIVGRYRGRAGIARFVRQPPGR